MCCNVTGTREESSLVDKIFPLDNVEARIGIWRPEMLLRAKHNSGQHEYSSRKTQRNKLKSKKIKQDKYLAVALVRESFCGSNPAIASS